MILNQNSYRFTQYYLIPKQKMQPPVFADPKRDTAFTHFANIVTLFAINNVFAPIGDRLRLHMERNDVIYFITQKYHKMLFDLLKTIVRRTYGQSEIPEGYYDGKKLVISHEDLL